MCATGFEQVEGADDVGVNEIARAGDGPVHVRFRRQVHDVRDGVLFDNAHHGGLVAQVHLLKNVFRVFGNLFQIFQVSGISEAIEIDEFGAYGVVSVKKPVAPNEP